jgi:dihydrofolate synthase/folylpolyglutamate synthase
MDFLKEAQQGYPSMSAPVTDLCRPILMNNRLHALWDELTGRTDYERCARPRAARFDLSGMAGLVERLGHPERSYQVLHVAGSKGKGTLCHFLERGLRAAGQRTGLYTSPHLQDWRERILVGGAGLPDDALADAIEEVLAASRGEETFFDLMTATAFVAMRAAGVEVGVVEVGLGGRSDSTNVVQPAAAAVTSIELEHVEVLGPTVEAIAGEKAGVFKTGSALWRGDGLPPAALRVLESRAASVNETLRSAPEGDAGVPPGLRAHPLAHVRRLGALATAMLSALPDPGVRAAAALHRLSTRELEVAGRWERRRLADGRSVILDLAHTASSLRPLLAAFRAAHPDAATRGVLLALREEKDPAQLAAALGVPPPGERWWTCPAGNHPRGADPLHLATAFGATPLAAPGFPAGPKTLLVTGSTYLVGALRSLTFALPEPVPSCA